MPPLVLEMCSKSTIIQQDQDDTGSTASDDGVHVMKSKSLTIKQFLHSHELGVGPEELHDRCVVACRIMMEI